MAARNVDLDNPTLDDLTYELERASRAGKIAYYHIGKVPSATSFISEVFYQDELFDVYIGLQHSVIHREDALKKYIRKKYGMIVRVLVIETHP